MQTNWVIEQKVMEILGSDWRKVYETNHQDWAELEFEALIFNLPKNTEYRLVKREVVTHYKPD